MNPLDITYIHYGAKQFNPSFFNPVKNMDHPKPVPQTGLWGSPVNSKWGWKDWCESEQFKDCNPQNSFRFKLNPDSKVLIIDSENDLCKITWIESDFFHRINYEEMSIHYDAIFLTQKGLMKTRYTFPKNLNSWDCESILVMQNVIQPLTQ